MAGVAAGPGRGGGGVELLGPDGLLSRTTNPIESTFATARHCTKVTKGPGSRSAGLAMAFKLIEVAEARWRAVNAPHLVALVRAGAASSEVSLSSVRQRLAVSARIE